jgi:hypothetical protein
MLSGNIFENSKTPQTKTYLLFIIDGRIGGHLQLLIIIVLSHPELEK